MTERSLNNTQLTIIDNIKIARENISDALASVGADGKSVSLMAVTKTVDPMRINTAIDECGIDLIGENKVGEFLDKKPFLHLDGVKTHLIGHLQTNKIKKILPEVEMIESVDSQNLLLKINEYSGKIDRQAQILIEINIGREESKTGVLPEELNDIIGLASELDHVKVLGLMAVPPICEKESEIRAYFAQMYKLFVDITVKKKDNINMDILSMGMSSDYVYAVKEGANLVRLGSALFGDRRY